MKKPLISVIMPAYNVQDFVKDAIESVLAQTYENIEFLIINDGSTDDTEKVCKEFALQDRRISVINQKNAGAAAARNHGIRLAKGEYILFMDSDDTMHPQAIEILLKIVSDNSVCLGMVDFLEVNAPYKDWTSVTVEEAELYSQEKMMDILCSCGENLKLRLLLTVPWCKLYHRDLLDGLAFPEGTICEDEFMINSIVSRCEKMAYSEIPLYGYLVRPGSVMHVKFDRKRLASMKAFEERIGCAKALGFKECEDKMIKTFIKDHIGNYCLAYSEHCDDNEVYRWLKQSFRKNFKKYYRILEKSQRIKGLIFYISPGFYLVVKKLILHDVYEG